MGLGINFIDMYIPNPELWNKLSAAIEGRREELVLQGHICLTWENRQYTMRCRRRCRTAISCWNIMHQNVRPGEGAKEIGRLAWEL